MKDHKLDFDLRVLLRKVVDQRPDEIGGKLTRRSEPDRAEGLLMASMRRIDSTFAGAFDVFGVVHKITAGVIQFEFVFRPQE